MPSETSLYESYAQDCVRSRDWSSVTVLPCAGAESPQIITLDGTTEVIPCYVWFA